MKTLDIDDLAALSPPEQIKAVAEFIGSLPPDRLRSIVIGTKVAEEDGENNRYTCFWIGNMPDAGQIIEVFARAYAQTVTEMMKSDESPTAAVDGAAKLAKLLH